ncbi:hypothetical protein SYNTR_2235 [Candidatus Syntrophocurvum alkaliphilum]|uniref:histidine kinase n=1 Tax=Candidatus Syntrophocurvum alkaliphilum TaxID=2293317 RepID=A0A6I6DJS6_9FIRM|nr:PAS domain S-box protein [Candidatus Syntrophocurvum alkaliphilum]QGU00829.1 hypothetical protein SYNTR_2235 [Candidatus Syntrophocurvum alkaliphilum]
MKCDNYEKTKGLENASIFYDTVSKNKETIIKEYETVFNKTQDALFLLSYTKDENFKFITINAKTEKLLGITQDEICEKTPFEAFESDTAKILTEHYKNCVEQKKTITFEECISFADGNIIFLTTLTPILENDTINYIVGSSKDITKQKKAEIQLMNKSNELERFFSITPDLLCIADTDGNFIKVNKAWEDILGYTKSELEKRTFLEFVHPEDIDATINAISRLADNQTITNFVNRYISKDGSYRYIEWKSQPYKNHYIYAAARDITDNQLLLEKIEKNKERYKSIVKILQYKSESSGDLLNYTLNESITMLNSTYGYIFLYNDSGELFLNSYSDKTIENCFINKDRFTLEHGGIWGEAIRQQKPIIVNNFQAPHPLKKGYPKEHIKLNNFLSIPVINNNNIVAIVGMANKKDDYTEEDAIQLKLLFDSIWDTVIRKEATEALHKEQELLQITLQSISEGVITTTPDGRIVMLNNAAEKITGWQASEANDKDISSILKVVSKDHDKRFEKYKKFVTEDLDNYKILLDKNGNEKVVTYSIQPLNDTKEVNIGYVIVFNDVTNKLLFEKKLANLDRFNLIGEMASSIAHEIRNPMTSVRGYIQLLNSTDEFKDHKECFEIMLNEIDKANNIISEFLTLSKHKMLELKHQNLNNIISSLYPLIVSNASLLDLNVKLELKSIPDIMLDKNEIRKLFLNIVNNALEAMDIGTVTIKTYVEKNSVVLSVTDEGKGIDDIIKDKLFTPFATTKENGTGLGLPICYKIAERHNAIIRFNSDNNGTTFEVVFKDVK